MTVLARSSVFLFVCLLTDHSPRCLALLLKANGSQHQAEVVAVPPSTGAACLDGSPYSFKIQKRGDPLRWTIYVPGGGWCWDEGQCDKRSQAGFHGARKSFDDEEYSQCWNYELDGTPIECTFVELQYCDASSMAGNLDKPFLTSSGTKVTIRGRRNFEASIDILKERYGLKKATDVVLAGSSAGGVAAMLHVDGLAKQLPKTKVRGVVQDGFFLDHARRDPNRRKKFAFDGIFEFHHVVDQLSSKCLHEYKGSEWLCFVGQHAARFVDTPSFFMNSKYDSFQLKHIFELKGNICKTATNTLLPDVRKYGKDFMHEFAKWRQTNSHHAAYLSSCVCHDCGWEHQEFKGEQLGSIFGRWYHSSDAHSPPGHGNKNIFDDERAVNTECGCAEA